METTSATRGRVELARGLRLHAQGPASDACASLALARAGLTARPGSAPSQSAATAALCAVDAAWAAGDLPVCVETVREGLAALRHAHGTAHDYLTGLLALLEGREGSAALQRVVRRSRDRHDGETLLRGASAALLTGDLVAACRAGAQALARARSTDDVSLVARATEHLAYAELRAGRHAQAREHAETGWQAAVRSGRVNTAAHLRAVLALVASVQGPSSEVADHAAAASRTARQHGLAPPVTLAEWALARAELADGRPADAATRLGSLVAPVDGGAHFALRGLVLPTLVEAAVAAGDPARARAVLPELESWGRSAADPLAPALRLRCRALLAPEPGQVDDLYARAHLAHLEAAGDFERARTLLLHGMWLRRQRRPGEARGRLGAALQLLERCGAELWAGPARAELRAAGAAPRAPEPDGSAPDGLAGLTPHQARIARCVATGETNREIAARLAVSVRTVDCHLRNIFAALGVRSRVELARRVPTAPDAP
ncbi:hypothetical protein GCM10009718_23450 [Isoptericola halotolerans]|uniref:DNA-binding CsgD family transcriptional regulator n=1 Tax=Isoptericola halotolerans TaxID=300560 RepID=A0ABX2A5G0_9MICO|nr:LuxR family transcriptional regulator [Isoptericola halotolerans]NOV98092.1 DNA-binding CsgD family transcriptional regulator [Isoptericola halotolerans]